MVKPSAAWIVGLGLAAAAATAGAAAPQRLTPVQSSYPHPSPDGSKVVFQSNRTGSWQIFVVGTDGTGLRQLTDLPGDNQTPKWSPDGTRIVFAASTGEGPSDILVMNADGSGVRRLVDHPADDGHPHWFPDGTRVVFNSSRTTPDPTAEWGQQWHEVFSVALDGSDVRQHTRCRAVCTYPSVSPDGRWLAFRKTVVAPGLQWDLTPAERNSEVFVVGLDGSGERNLSRSGAFDGWPAWPPDGRSVTFASNRTGPARVASLWSADLASGEVRQLARGEGDWGLVQPAWSADGTRVFAYMDHETIGGETGDVVVLEPER